MLGAYHCAHGTQIAEDPGLQRAPGGKAFAPIADLARHPPVADVRREAVEAVGQLGGRADDTTPLLEELASADPDRDVRREAIEQLAHLRDAQAAQRLARTGLNQH